MCFPFILHSDRNAPLIYEVTRYSIKYLKYRISTFVRCIYFPPEKMSPSINLPLNIGEYEDMKCAKMPSLLQRAYYCLWCLRRRQIRCIYIFIYIYIHLYIILFIFCAVYCNTMAQYKQKNAPLLN